ncbi:hypothetical protein CEXT_586011 [Caerostris extrusa]|uniref:Uncharacterized protein n=1 Tax=Caerostris extrusa TaxID=172846 RepID=A0AAV4QNQ0_CAEEX|nr:hypothetical protein CEXT_586011 [Caerostris extrusa]
MMIFVKEKPEEKDKRNSSHKWRKRTWKKREREDFYSGVLNYAPSPGINWRLGERERYECSDVPGSIREARKCSLQATKNPGN